MAVSFQMSTSISEALDAFSQRPAVKSHPILQGVNSERVAPGSRAPRSPGLLRARYSWITSSPPPGQQGIGHQTRSAQAQDMRALRPLEERITLLVNPATPIILLLRERMLN